MRVLAEKGHCVTRQESGFDRACDSAYQYALMHFGIDCDGHSDRLAGWERSMCWIEVEFVGYVRIGHEHNYKFTTRACINDDEEDE